MYSAVAGLSAHQTKMNVIGNNIANVNTYGFKSSRVAFSDVFYQTLNGASAPTNNSGAINASQLGYGAKVASVDVINTRAGSADTGRSMDIYINGDGYIPVKSSDGTVKYTRVGNLKFDPDGNLTDNNGNLVLCLPINDDTGLPELDSNGTIDVQRLTTVKLDPNETYTGIAIGTNGEITAIKAGDPTFIPGPSTGWIKSSVLSPTSELDSPVKITTTRSNNVDFVPATGIDGAQVTAFPDDANVNGTMKVYYDTTTGEYKMDYKFKDSTATQTVTGVTDGGTNVTTFTVPNRDGTGTSDIEMTLTTDTTGTTPGIVVPDNGDSLTLGTAVAEEVTIKAVAYDAGGNEVSVTTTWDPSQTGLSLLNGELTLEIDPEKFGSLGNLAAFQIGNVGEGEGVSSIIGNLATANFDNADGLVQSGSGYYLQSASSGEAIVGKPGANGTGTLRSSALEMSNVDLSKEFTEMITTQRGFQANTRMITVSDEMLSELVSMKR